jgi:hypothetical protein
MAVRNTVSDFEEPHNDEEQFEILDQLHAKLQSVEKTNIELKQKSIENVRLIASLENRNVTLETKVKKLQTTNSDSEGNLEEIAGILAEKDEKIEELIAESAIQNDLREELSQVKRKLITL